MSDSYRDDFLNTEPEDIFPDEIPEEELIPEPGLTETGELGLFAELKKAEYDSVLRNDVPVRPKLRAGESDTASLASDVVYRSASEDAVRERARLREAQIERDLKTEDEKALQAKYREARKAARKRNLQEVVEEKTAARKERERKAEAAERAAVERHRRVETDRIRHAREAVERRKKNDAAKTAELAEKRNRKANMEYYRQKEKESRKLQALREENSRPLRQKPMWKSVLETAIYIAVIVALAFFIVKFVVQKTVVEGPSMYPTLESGDHLILEKVSYAFGEPDRFDIIVFRIPGDERTYYIKRVIALPGETVQIAEGVIYIDGIPLEENYGYEEMAYAGLCANPLTLGEGEYFVIGDNRNNSTDSRYESVGPVTEEQILGHAVLRIWPINEISLLTD